MSDLEKDLFDAIKISLNRLSLKHLRSVFQKLSKRYRSGTYKFFKSDEERVVYIATRMPATFNVLRYVFNELKKISPNFKIKKVLDLGSGPATTLWSILSIYPEIKKIHLVERDRHLIEMAKKLLENLKEVSSKAEFERNDILRVKNFDYDLVCLSYVANELKDYELEKIINRFILSKAKIIIFVEPGTKYGFKKIKFIRQKLIDENAKIIAPCPNELKCPIKQNDWCHFFTRLKRSKTHKYIKGADLAFEDEKFSYVIATKEDVAHFRSRVLRNTKSQKDEIDLTLCLDGEVKKEKIFRKDKQRFKKAKKLKWGDVFNDV